MFSLGICTGPFALHCLVQVCAATDPLSGKFVDPDLFGHIIEKMRLAIAQGDTQEPSSNKAGFHFPRWYFVAFSG